MTPNHTTRSVPARLREEAAEWFIALREQEVDSSRQGEFDQWLRKSPQHVKAFLRISAVWDAAEMLVPNDPRELAANIADAPPAPKSFATWQGIAACLLLIGLLAAGAMWWLGPHTLTYETRAGELRTLRLPDGSTVQMNARSRVEATFTARERAVELVTGEALFCVAKDATRPFSVRTDSAHIKAVGTQFDVYRKSTGTLVTVVQGAVSMQDDLLVSAGEQAMVQQRAALDVRPANIPAAIAWTEGNLMFDSTPLSDVAAEFNRVGLRRLILEDTSLLNLHISGVFRADDPSSLIEFLRARFGVQVEETNSDVRVKRARKN